MSCINLPGLPCGCNYCIRAHRNWSEFQEAVYDAVPLATYQKLGPIIAQMEVQLDTKEALHTSIEVAHIHGELLINSSHTDHK